MAATDNNNQTGGNMIRRLGSLIIKAEPGSGIVTVTVEGLGTKQVRNSPRMVDLAHLINTWRGFWPDTATLRACSEVARAAATPAAKTQGAI